MAIQVRDHRICVRAAASAGDETRNLERTLTFGSVEDAGRRRTLLRMARYTERPITVFDSDTNFGATTQTLVQHVAFGRTSSRNEGQRAAVRSASSGVVGARMKQLPLCDFPTISKSASDASKGLWKRSRHRTARTFSWYPKLRVLRAKYAGFRASSLRTVRPCRNCWCARDKAESSLVGGCGPDDPCRRQPRTCRTPGTFSQPLWTTSGPNVSVNLSAFVHMDAFVLESPPRRRDKLHLHSCHLT